MKKRKEKNKKVIKLDKIDCYIRRYRENIRLQDELEKKRKWNIIGSIFKKDV